MSRESPNFLQFTGKKFGYQIESSSTRTKPRLLVLHLRPSSSFSSSNFSSRDSRTMDDYEKEDEGSSLGALKAVVLTGNAGLSIAILKIPLREVTSAFSACSQQIIKRPG
jgi:hypothetical protein